MLWTNFGRGVFQDSWHQELMQRGTIFQFGLPPNRIDLINNIEGVTFEEAWKKRTKTTMEFSGETIRFTSLALRS